MRTIRNERRFLAAVFAVVLLCTNILCCAGGAENAVERTAEFLVKNVESPGVSSVGGEWTVTALAKCGMLDEEYAECYLKNLDEYLKECGGILHTRKYTEYSRVVFALNALDKNPRDAAGYNLLIPLADFEAVTAQGLNGAIWALVALDSGGYEIPQTDAARVSATRDMYVDFILGGQTECGGFALSASGGTADPDLTGMALYALAEYSDRAEVRLAVERAVEWLASVQTENGGYISGGTENSESAAQVLRGLCAVGISADDKRFIKKGKTIIDNILSFEAPNGGFFHIKAEESANLMASEQALLGLAAAMHAENKISGEKTSSFGIDDSGLFGYMMYRRCFDKETVFLYNNVGGLYSAKLPNGR